MRRSRNDRIRHLCMAAVTLVAVFLLLGPSVVEPIHPRLGVPYTQLPTDHEDHLPPGAPQRALAVFCLCLGLWVTDVIPLPATSLLALGLLPLLNVMPHAKAFAYFGNSAVFFILGVFILAAAMIETGLSKRLTLRFLHWFDHSPRRLVLGVLVCGAFFSLWMPEHAVAAMMYPLVLEIAEALGLKRPGSAYARSLFLALAWGTVAGGVGTYLGGARAMLAVELYQKFHPGAAAPSFLEYAIVAMPTVVLMIAITYGTISIASGHEIDSIAQATRMLADRVRELGPLAPRERRLAILSGGTILAWILVPSLSGRVLGYRIDLGVIALLAAVMVFALHIVEWKRIQGFVNWGVVVMYGGAVALGAAVADTHAMDWIADRIVPHLQSSRFLMVAVVTIVSIIMTEAMSNAAVVSLLLPVAFGLSRQLGVEPLAMLFLVTIPAGLGFCLPMGSPPVAISFSAGYYGVGAVVWRGMILNIASVIVFLAVAYLYWPLIGIRL